MAAISQFVTIEAEREAIFDLISCVEEFPLYAHALKEVERIGYRTYRWVACVRGFTLSWDSTITEFHRPVRLAWRSIRGFKNSGTYKLTKIAGGTKVELSIEYSLQAGALGRLMEALVTPVTHAAAAAILQRVKERLEPRHAGMPAKEHMNRNPKVSHALAKMRHADPHA